MRSLGERLEALAVSVAFEAFPDSMFEGEIIAVTVAGEPDELRALLREAAAMARRVEGAATGEVGAFAPYSVQVDFDARKDAPHGLGLRQRVRIIPEPTQ